MPLCLEYNRCNSSRSFLICSFVICFRKFAAQLANKQQQPVPEVDRKPLQSVPTRKESLDHHTIIEEDDSMGDSAVPMFVQHTEAMLDEIDRMVMTESLLFCTTIVLVLSLSCH